MVGGVMVVMMAAAVTVGDGPSSKNVRGSISGLQSLRGAHRTKSKHGSVLPTRHRLRLSHGQASAGAREPQQRRPRQSALRLPSHATPRSQPRGTQRRGVSVPSAAAASSLARLPVHASRAQRLLFRKSSVYAARLRESARAAPAKTLLDLPHRLLLLRQRRGLHAVSRPRQLSRQLSTNAQRGTHGSHRLRHGARSSQGTRRGRRALRRRRGRRRRPGGGGGRRRRRRRGGCGGGGGTQPSLGQRRSGFAKRHPPTSGVQGRRRPARSHSAPPRRSVPLLILLRARTL